MCFSKVNWVDFSHGNPNSIVNIIGDFIPGIDRGSNTYSVQNLTSQQEKWNLMLDNNAAQVHPSRYVGFMAGDKEHYYRVVPVTALLDRKGNRKDLLMVGGSRF